MRVVFTKIADFSYEEIQEFLTRQWTEREVELFITETQGVVNHLRAGKFLMYQKYSGNIRSALIGKNHVRMYFRKVSNFEINVLYFFDMRDDPEKLKLFFK